MNLLDRYIFKSVFFTCMGAIGLFGFVIVLANLIKDLLGYILSGQLGFMMTAELILLLVPIAISYALPMGILCGVLLVLGRISADCEITAMRASGISLARIARPVLILGFLGAATTLYVNFQAMPWGRVQFENRLIDALRANPLSLLVQKTFIRSFPGFVVYVGKKDGEALQNLWVYELDREGRAIRILHADEGQARFDSGTNELVVTFTRARVEDRSRDRPEDFARAPIVGFFERTETIRLSLEEILGRPPYRQKLAWMTHAQLRAEWDRIAARDVAPELSLQHERELMKVSLTIHNKINFALAVFSFAFIGVPLGITVSRRETSANLGLATLLALGYYLLSVMVEGLDQQPHLRPDLLLWLPNALFIGLGLWLFKRAER